MTGSEHRQRILGDVGDSSPERWQLGRPSNPEPHVLLMLYRQAMTTGAGRAVSPNSERRSPRAGLELITTLDTRLAGERHASTSASAMA